MKYFIITKKHINILIVSICILAFILTGSVVLSNLEPKTVQTFSPTSILKSQLITEDKEENIKDKILGFSPDKPSSIISEYSPLFDDVPTEKKEQQKATPTPTPEKQTVEEKKITGGNKMKNQTNYDVNLLDFQGKKLNLNKEPTVLIIHTHITESYAPEDENMYFINYNSRSTDENRNMIAIGKVIGDTLKSNGINVIHDTTFHDYPVYNGAYGRSLATIKSQQSENKDINVILDVHRDAVTGQGGAQVKVLSEINGEKTAQVMLVVGTDAGGLSHSGWRDNLTFASKIQKIAEEKYQGLMRPLNLREERFNQHTTPCSIIIEVGTNANTLSEAKRGAELIGEVVSEVLK